MPLVRPAHGGGAGRRRPGHGHRCARGRPDVRRDGVGRHRPRRRGPRDGGAAVAGGRGDARRCGRNRGERLGVDGVDPVVGGLEGVDGEGRGRRVGEDPVAVGRVGRGQRVEGRPIGRCGEGVERLGVVAVGRQVRHDVRGAGGHRHRGGEADLLPARGRLAREGGLGQQRAAGAPEAAHVGARVGGGLVEAHAGDVAAGVGGEGGPDVDRRAVPGVGDWQGPGTRRSCRDRLRAR